MNKFSSEVLDIIFAFGKCILDFALFHWFTIQFFPLKKEKCRILSCTVIIVLALCLYFINSLHIPKLNTAAALTCALIINFLLFKGHAAALLLCSIAEVLLIVICEFIPISVYSLIYSSNIAAITDETIKNAGFNLISTGIFTVIIIAARYMITIKKHLNNKNVTITENFAIAIVPVVSMLIIYYILDINCPDSKNVNAWHGILLFFGILLMNIIVITGDNNLRKRYQLQRKLDELSRLENLNKVVIEQQDQYIEELKGFAHDYAKQIEGLNLILLNEDPANPLEEKIKNYQAEMCKSIEYSYRFAFIPSPALRTILSQAQLHCNAAGIAFHVDIQYADFSFIAFPDLYTLFENPLDNAITACSSIKSETLKKEIHLSLFRKKNLIWIELKNTKTNPILLRNNIIQTTKEDSESHGMGIKNIKRTVRKYGGYLNIDYTQNEFSLTMTIPAAKK